MFTGPGDGLARFSVNKLSLIVCYGSLLLLRTIFKLGLDIYLPARAHGAFHVSARNVGVAGFAPSANMIVFMKVTKNTGKYHIPVTSPKTKQSTEE